MAISINPLKQSLQLLNKHFNTRWANEFKLSYLFLQQVDLIFTVYAMSHGAMELNPILRVILSSIPLIFLFKLLIPLLMVYLIPGGLLVPGIVFQAIVLIWNVKELWAANLLT